MKKLLPFILCFFFYVPVYSQRVIELKEVKVFPENFSQDLIEKMKIAVKKNYKKNISNYKVDIEYVKNDTDTLANVKQESMIQIDALKMKKYKILKSNGKAFYREDFFKMYDLSDLFKYGLLEGRLNVLLDISEYPFFNNFSEYNYQVSDLTNFYEISFSSTNKYIGKVKIAKESSNILELEFEDLSNASFLYRGLTAGPAGKIKYINVVIDTKELVNKAHLYFSVSKDKKILLDKISSSIKLSQFEVSKYELNKANKILSKENMRLNTDLILERIN